MSHGLGRIPVKDDRDNLFTMEGELPKVLPELPSNRYYTTPGLPLDQKSTPMCVGYATRGLLNTGPVTNLKGPTAVDIYHHAQQLDGIPGEDYDGTNDRGSLKYLKTLGYVTRYVWTHNAQTAMTWVLAQGPVLIGINWYSSFDKPDKSFVLKVTPTAKVRGGHEVLVVGANMENGLFRCMNSWGENWGEHGRFWLPAELLQRLLNEGGDCVSPTEVLVP